ncbi:MAG TPA: ABC transporter substrate-binding protein [Candidatus Polarisedimenticolaceae bacterium]|jgi:NitT/TauT family transport system substrate-binding protein|nr:ABC transporter substrate-binding protein [Candidatus Polarisedimenticolaceae bacterium]
MSRLWIAFFLLLSTVDVAAQPLTRVMSGYAATSGPHAVLWLAREAGLFEKNGLRTDVAYIRSGSTMGQALVAGEIQLAQMGGPAALAAGVAGFDVTMVAVALNTTPIVIMGKVAKMEELKGKAIGVTRYGSNTDISARFAIRKAGMQPEKDVALIQLEDYAGIMGGIQSGRIAAGALADPFTDHAKKLGYKEIADIAALGLEFPFVGIVTKKTFIKEQPDLVQRFVRAYTESIALYKNDRELAKKVTSKYTGIKDPEILNSTVDFYAPKLASVPYPTIGGIRFVLDQVATRDPRAKNYNPETFMDLRFVKQLEESGFIKGLNRK